MRELSIGIIGADTSHAVIFAELLNNPEHKHHVQGGKVKVAFPGGSPDFALSANRVEGFTKRLHEEFGVQIVHSPEEVAEACDAVLLTSADGRVHLDQFKRIAAYSKPVFLDKPLALTSQDALEIKRLAETSNIPIMSASSLRYDESLVTALGQQDKGRLIGADVYGPMSVEPTQSYYFWYGIHAVEMLFAIMGIDCLEVTAVSGDQYEWIVGRWRDGRIGTVRGNLCGNLSFGAMLHFEQSTVHVDTATSVKPYYACLLEQVMNMFRTGTSPLDLYATLEIIRFLEAAELSRMKGSAIRI